LIGDPIQLKPLGFFGTNTKYRIWVYFFLFLAGLSLISFGKFSVVAQLEIAVLGLLFPFVLALWTAPAVQEEGSEGREELLPLSNLSWMGIPLFLAASLLVIRFFKMGSSSWWLGGDETLMALSSLQWLQGWHWKSFVTIGQDPSTLSHFSYLVLKLTGSFILSYQIPPAIISCLTAWAAYAASRQYFSRSISGIVLFLWVFSEWPLLISYPLLPGILMPLWCCFFFYVLAKLNEQRDGNRRAAWSFVSGFVLGLGPYTFFAWPVLFVLGCGLLFGWVWTKKGKGNGEWKWGVLGSLLALAPFLWAAYREGYGDYILDVSGLGRGRDLVQQAGIVLKYLFLIFFGRANEDGTWANDGFLNVLLGSAFLLGWIELAGRRRLFWVFGAGFFLFLLPGILSHDVEPHRILLLLPLLLAVTALGIGALFRTIALPQRSYWVILFLTACALIDLRRAEIPLKWNGPPLTTRNERQFSYEVLKPVADQLGPGLIFTEMIPNTKDFSFTYCSDAFNAALNPGLSPLGARWAAIFTEAHYIPILTDRFPGIRWYSLPTTDPKVASGHVLGWVLLNEKTKPIFMNWIEFQRFWLNNAFAMVDSPNGKTTGGFLLDFLEFYPKVPKDPYLQSCYFQRLVYLYSAEKAFRPNESEIDWARFSPTFHAAFDQSYRTMVLCERFARICMMEDKNDEAASFLKQALRLSPHNSWLEYELRQTRVK